MADIGENKPNSRKENPTSPSKIIGSSSSTHFTNGQNRFPSFNGAGFGQAPQGPAKDYKNIREYARDLQCWLWQYRMLQVVGSIQSQMFANMHHARLQQTSSTTANSAFSPGVNSSVRTGQPAHAAGQAIGIVQTTRT